MSSRPKRHALKAKATHPPAKPLPQVEKQRLNAALETARENVKPTVKRLIDSESVGTDLLSMRLELSPSIKSNLTRNFMLSPIRKPTPPPPHHDMFYSQFVQEKNPAKTLKDRTEVLCIMRIGV